MKLSALMPLAAVALALAPLAVAADAPAFPGTAVVANTGDPKAGTGKALIVWDATDEVADIVSKKQDADTANGRLSHDALHALAANVKALDPNAAQVTVRVIYQKTGAVSPIYGTATLAGVERYATLTMSGKDAEKNRDGWQSLGNDAKLPAFAAFAVIGKLP